MYLHADKDSDNADTDDESQPDQHLRNLGLRENIQTKLQDKDKLTEQVLINGLYFMKNK